MTTLFKRGAGTYKDPKVCLLWSKRLSTPMRLLSRNILREICLYLTPNELLPDLRTSTLRFLNTRTLSRTPQVLLTLSLSLNTTSTQWILLTSGSSVLCCGGKVNKNWMTTSWVVHGSGEVEKKGRMIRARGLHGMVQWKEFGLVFGGESKRGGLKECESLKLPKGRNWEELPPMQASRHSFNPCLFRDLIYLFGCGSSELEAFAPRQNSYIPLNIHFPYAATCCLYMNSSTLTIVSTTFLVRYHPETGEKEEPMRLEKSCLTKGLSTQPVVDEVRRRVYGLHGGKGWSFDMDTGLE